MWEGGFHAEPMRTQAIGGGGGWPAGASALTLEAPKIEAHLKFAIISCHLSSSTSYDAKRQSDRPSIVMSSIGPIFRHVNHPLTFRPNGNSRHGTPRFHSTLADQPVAHVQLRRLADASSLDGPSRWEATLRLAIGCLTLPPRGAELGQCRERRTRCRSPTAVLCEAEAEA